MFKGQIHPVSFFVSNKTIIYFSARSWCLMAVSKNWLSLNCISSFTLQEIGLRNRKKTKWKSIAILLEMGGVFYFFAEFSSMFFYYSEGNWNFLHMLPTNWISKCRNDLFYKFYCKKVRNDALDKCDYDINKRSYYIVFYSYTPTHCLLQHW